MSETMNPRLPIPLSMCFAACSGSGKTHLAKFFLLNQQSLLTENWTRIFYATKYDQLSLKHELAHLPIEFLPAGELPVIEELKSRCKADDRILIVVDDLMLAAVSSPVINNLFVAGRHLLISIMYMSQNLFAQGPFCRNIRLNANYLVLFKAIHDTQQIRRYFMQMSANHARLMDIYKDATRPDYGYLLIDLRHKTPAELRFRTNIQVDRQTLYSVNL